MNGKKMNGKKILTVLIAAVITLAMASCAEEGPGMSNVENVNSVLRLESLIVPQDVDLMNGNTVDTNSVTFTATISVDKAAPEQDESTMTAIDFSHYKVEYVCDDPTWGYAFDPIEHPIQAYVEPGDDLSLGNYIAMPADYKEEYVTKMGVPTDMVLYEFRFTFYGVNQFGQEVKVKGSDFTYFADFQ